MKKFVLSIVLLLTIMPARALQWQDLWYTKDQQAKKLLEKKQFSAAKTTFTRNDWRAVAAYRDNDFATAAAIFQSLHNTDRYYNLGNALARLGKYKQAIQAYDKALTITPDDKDALFNRNILKELLRQNKKDKKESSDDKQDQNKNNGQQNKDKEAQQPQKQEKQDAAPKSPNNKNNPSQKPKTNKQSSTPAKMRAPNNAQSQEKREQQQENDLLLRLIPDDPGGLLREKFMRDYLRRQQGVGQ